MPDAEKRNQPVPISEPPILADLLARAGIDADWRARRINADGEVNEHWRIDAPAGCFVARIFRWPFRAPEPFDRYAKERLLLARLAESGAPVPTPLASSRSERVAGILFPHVSGKTLGQLTAAGGPIGGAWRAAGESLRTIHAYQISQDDACRPLLRRPGQAAEETAGTRWSAWYLGMLRGQVERVSRHQPALDGLLRRALSMAEAAGEVLDQAPLRLLHGDAHCWNVLVREESDEIRPVWLDWEFAMLGDPAYDLVRLTRYRIMPITPPVDDLLEGYGTVPHRGRVLLYELLFYLQMANDARHFRPRPAYTDAQRYLADLDRRLNRLDEVLAAE